MGGESEPKCIKIRSSFQHVSTFEKSTEQPDRLLYHECHFYVGRHSMFMSEDNILVKWLEEHYRKVNWIWIFAWTRNQKCL